MGHNISYMNQSPEILIYDMGFSESDFDLVTAECIHWVDSVKDFSDRFQLVKLSLKESTHASHLLTQK